METGCCGPIDLKTSGSKYGLLFECALDRIFLLDLTGRIIDANYAAVNEYGYAYDELLSLNIKDLCLPGEGGTLDKQLHEAYEKGAVYETFHRRKNGSTFPVEVSSRCVILDEAHLLIMLVRDITERKQAEQALKKSQFILAKSQEMAHMGNWAWNPRTNELNMSDEGFRIFGYQPQEFQPTLDWVVSRVYPEDRELVAGIFDSIRSTGWLGSVDYRIVLPDGRIRYLNMLADKLVRDQAGPIRWVYGISQDITERKQGEEALLASRRQLADIINHLPDATLVIDSEKKVIVWNRAMEELTGVTATAVIGQGNYAYAVPIYGERRPLLIDLIFEPDTAIDNWHYTNIRRVGREVMAEASFTGPHSKPLVTWAKATPLFDRAGKLIGAIESIRDITELRQAEAVLRESEEKFRVLAETSPTAIFLYQGENLVYVNRAAEKMSGYTREELYSKKFRDLIHPAFRALVVERGFARQQGKEVPSLYEFKYVRKNGDEGWALLSAGHIEYRGKPAGLATILDITQRKKAEEELEEAKNRAELYVDLMSHDIGNLNHATMGYLELAMEILDLRGEETDLIAKPVELLQNSTKLIDDVKKIQSVKTGEIAREPVDVGELLARVVSQFHCVPGRDVKIEYSPLPGCLVQGNRYLADAFSHLIENAIKHSRGPLSIYLRISRVAEDSQACYQVAVEDTGPGIPDERKKYLFAGLVKEEFKSRRLGLGLQLVKAIVESVHGKIRVEDRVPGEFYRGSRFVVLLPASEN